MSPVIAQAEESARAALGKPRFDAEFNAARGSVVMSAVAVGSRPDQASAAIRDDFGF